MTTLHFVVVIALFVGVPCYIMSQCEHIVPLNVPTPGRLKVTKFSTAPVKLINYFESLCFIFIQFGLCSIQSLQDYVLVLSPLPILLFWEPLCSSMVVNTLHLAAWAFGLKFYLLRDYKTRNERRRAMLHGNVWHHEQPFMADIPPQQEEPLDPQRQEQRPPQRAQTPLPHPERPPDAVYQDPRLCFGNTCYDTDSDEDLSDGERYDVPFGRPITPYPHGISNEELPDRYLTDQLDEDNEVKEDVDTIVIRQIAKDIVNNAQTFAVNGAMERTKRDLCSNRIRQNDSNHQDKGSVGLLSQMIERITKSNIEIERSKILETSSDDTEDKQHNHINRESAKCSRFETTEEIEFKGEDYMPYSVEEKRNRKQYGEENYKMWANRSRWNPNWEQELQDEFKREEQEIKERQMEQPQEEAMYFAAFIGEQNNAEFMAIPNREQIRNNDHNVIGDVQQDEEKEVGHDDDDDDDDEFDNNGNLMAFLDGIDLGGHENVIPAPILMSIQLDTYGRLVRINVELDSYDDVNKEESTESNRDDPVVDHSEHPVIVQGDNVEDDRHQQQRHQQQQPHQQEQQQYGDYGNEQDLGEEKEEKEENTGDGKEELTVDIGAMMQSLNGYQKGELMRDILELCHPLYISEDIFFEIYDRNTVQSTTNPAIRILRKSSELISIHEVISIFDKLSLWIKVTGIVVVAVLFLNLFHLMLFLQCLVYGRKLWSWLALIPHFFIFHLGFTNFTRFEQRGLLSFAFNPDAINDLHCIALAFWWFPMLYLAINHFYGVVGTVCRRFSESVDRAFDLILAMDISTMIARIGQSITDVFGYCTMFVHCLVLWTMHHFVIPLSMGMCIQFAVWAPVMLKTNQTLCLSVLEAFIEGLVVWELLLPIAPIAVFGGHSAFQERFRVYCDTPFWRQSLGQIVVDIYGPILNVMILHWFLPIAWVRSDMFKWMVFWEFEGSQPFLIRKDGMDSEELLLDFNKNFYLKNLMRNLIRLRILLFYKSAIKRACCNLWEQFINDRYVVGRKLVNYYYAVQEDQDEQQQQTVQEDNVE